MTISGNTIGIDNDGSGDIILTDVTLPNTKDVRLPGKVMLMSSTAVDSTTVSHRYRSLYTNASVRGYNYR